jgi:hypothetical protein
MNVDKEFLDALGSILMRCESDIYRRLRYYHEKKMFNEAETLLRAFSLVEDWHAEQEEAQHAIFQKYEESVF